MRRVVDTDMVPHLWANQSQDEARNKGGNFYFRGDTIYSYGGHFPIAKHVKNERGESAILYTTRRYSSTTNKHLSLVRRAIHGAPVFNVHRPDRIDHAQACKDYRDEILDFATKAARARTNAEYYLSSANAIIRMATAYAAFYDLKEAFTLPPETDVKAILANQRKATAEETKRRKEREAHALQELQDNVERWKRGELLDSWKINRYPSIVLRLGDDGLSVETSQGATVPLESALQLLPLVRSGRSWKRNGERIRIGDFQLDEVTEAGDVRIGCHFIKRGEIERIAAQIGK